MSAVVPTRSGLLALKQERRTLEEGYVFLDEKCLLLAGTMLRELQAHEALCAMLRERQLEALAALFAAVKRHGLQGLQCYPAATLPESMLEERERSLLGVVLQEASVQGDPPAGDEPVYASPEARACRVAYFELVRGLVALAAREASLERLYREYRRTMRRAHAVQDVLLPEVSRSATGMEASLEELEREEALWGRWARMR